MFGLCIPEIPNQPHFKERKMSAYEISDSMLAILPLFRDWQEVGCVISSVSSGEPETEEL